MRLTGTNYGWTTPTDNPWHVHDNWEILVILDGAGTTFIQDSVIKLHPGSIVLNPPGYVHRVQGDDMVLLVWFCLDEFVTPSREKIPVFEDEENRFCILSKMLYEITLRKRPNYENIQQALISTMYQLLVSWAQSSSEETMVDDLIREMIFNLSDPNYDPGVFIRNSGYCADHFRRRFQKITKKAPTAYLIDLRIDHAKRLLDPAQNGRMSIQEVAAHSGFHDPFYFSTIFKRRTGMSPSVYQKQFL